MAFNRAKWYAGGVAVQGTKVLVFWYRRNGRRTLKFPGGSQKKSDGRADKSPQETLLAELVGDREMMQAGSVKVLDLIWSNRLSDEHAQFWFLVEPNGELRDYEKVDQEEGMPDEFLSAPFWMEIEEVYKHPQTSELHRQLAPHLIAYMAKRNSDWGWIHRKLHVDELLAS